MNQTYKTITRKIKPIAKWLAIALIIGIAIWEYVKLLQCGCL